MYFQGKNIWLSKGKNVRFNYLKHDNVDYIIESLSEKNEKSKGGNSNVFKLINANTEDDYVIKFSKYDVNSPNDFTQKRIDRFLREVEALKTAKTKGFSRVVHFLFDGYKEIQGKKFHYYVMEKAEFDLTHYINTNEISTSQRLMLCIDILEGIKQLHSVFIYHRDIKPDNILNVSGEWKIGDLGLVDSRDSDFEIQEVGERIGPIGWLSPEATNKYLREGKEITNPNGFDCDLDGFSDVFQLGKLFWYIFQGNIPLGQIRREDFIIKDKVLYSTLLKMLRHCKNERLSIEDVEENFQSRTREYGL